MLHTRHCRDDVCALYQGLHCVSLAAIPLHSMANSCGVTPASGTRLPRAATTRSKMPRAFDEQPPAIQSNKRKVAHMFKKFVSHKRTGVAC